MEDWKRPINKYPVPLSSPSSSSSPALEIDIHVPTLRAENLHFQTWGSARVLAGQLHTIPLAPDTFSTTTNNNETPGINILELGAGTGLAGLAAAAFWQTQVVLTDLPPFVPGLASNIAANSGLLAARKASALSGALDWNSPSHLPVFTDDELKVERTFSSETEKASVIIAADTLYSEEHPRMLANAIFAWLKPGKGARVVVCYPLRVAYLDIIRDLWAVLEEGGLECVVEGKEEIRDEVWDDERLHEWCVFKWREVPS